MTNKKFKSILEDLLLSFPFQIPLMFTLVLGVHFLTRLSIWWCVPISFVLNIMYDIGERISIKVKKTPAALSQPGPEEPTDEELEAIARAAEIQYMKEHGGLTASTPDGIHAQLRVQRIAGLRAVAARWGRSATPTEAP